MEFLYIFQDVNLAPFVDTVLVGWTISGGGKDLPLIELSFY